MIETLDRVCSNCKKPINQYSRNTFCNLNCYFAYKEKNRPKNNIDSLLKLFFKYYGDTLPPGLLKDVADYLGISRERVRQKKQKLFPTILRLRKKEVYCPFDHKLIFNGRKFCSNYCKKNYRVKQFLSKLPVSFNVEDVMRVGSHNFKVALAKIFYLRHDGFIKRKNTHKFGQKAIYTKLFKL